MRKKRCVVNLVASFLFCGLFFFFTTHLGDPTISMMEKKNYCHFQYSLGSFSHYYRNIGIYSSLGIALFFFFNWVHNCLHSSFGNLLLTKMAHFIFLSVEFCIVFVFGDIVLQNCGGVSITITNFAIRYQAIAGFIVIELILIIDFFSNVRGSKH